MHVYVKNIPAKFHPDPIWSDGTFGFFEELYSPPQQEEKEESWTTWAAIWDQFQIKIKFQFTFIT